MRSLWRGVPPALLLLWLLLAVPLPASCQVTPLTSGAQVVLATVWGGGVSGVTPGKIDGALGVGSLGGTGASPWLGGCWYDRANSTLWIADGGAILLRKVSQVSGAGLVSLPGSNGGCGNNGFTTLVAVTGNSSARIGYGLDTNCLRVFTWNLDTASFISTTLTSSLGTTSFTSTATYSLLLCPSDGALYFNDNHRVFRVLTGSGAVSVVAGHVGTARSADGNLTVANFSSLSDIVSTFDGQRFLAIDNGTLRVIDWANGTVYTPVFASGSIVFGVALVMYPDGQSLLVADQISATVTQLKRVLWSALTPSGVWQVQVYAAGLGSEGYQSGHISVMAVGGVTGLTLGDGVARATVFTSESAYGRIRTIDTTTGNVAVFAGGGAAVAGSASSAPIGWARGTGADSAFEASASALVFNPAGTVGYLADPQHGLLHSLDVSTLSHEWLLGNPLALSASWSGYGVDGSGAQAQLPPITALTRDGTGTIYWTDTNATVRKLTAQGASASVCVCASQSGVGCFALNAGTTSPCSVILNAGPASGIVWDPLRYVLYLALSVNASSNPGRMLMVNAAASNVEVWCGTGTMKTGTQSCSTAQFGTLSSLAIHNDTLFAVEAATFSVRYVVLSSTSSVTATGFLLGCGGQSAPPGCSGGTVAGSTATELTLPTAIAIDTQGGYLYVADGASLRACLVTFSGSGVPSCSLTNMIGAPTMPGWMDGVQGAKPLSTITSMYWDSVATGLYVLDAGNMRVRFAFSVAAPNVQQPIIASVAPATGPSTTNVTVTLTGIKFTSNTVVSYVDYSSGVVTPCAPSTYSTSSTMYCTLVAGTLTSTRPVHFNALNNLGSTNRSLAAYTPNWCYANAWGNPQCPSPAVCNATAQTCTYPAPPPSSSSSSTSVSSSTFSSSRASSSQPSSSIASSSLSSSIPPSSSVASSSVASSSVFSSSVASSSVFSSSRWSSSVVSSSAVSSSAVSSSAWSSSLGSSSISSSLFSSSHASSSVSSSPPPSSSLSSSVVSSSVPFSSSPASSSIVSSSTFSSSGSPSSSSSSTSDSSSSPVASSSISSSPSSSVSSSTFSSSADSSSVSSSISSSIFSSSPFFSSSIFSSSAASSSAMSSSAMSSSDFSSSLSSSGLWSSTLSSSLAASSSAISSSAASSSVASSSLPSSSQVRSSATPTSSVSSSPFPRSSSTYSSSVQSSSIISSSVPSSSAVSCSVSSSPQPSSSPASSSPPDSSSVSSSLAASSSDYSSSLSSSLFSSSPSPSSSLLSSSPLSSSLASSSPFSSSLLSSSLVSSSPSSSPASSSASSSTPPSSSSSSSSPPIGVSSSVPPVPPPPPPPFSVSTMTPATLVQSQQATVVLTGVWLRSVVALYVDDREVPFTVSSLSSGGSGANSGAQDDGDDGGSGGSGGDNSELTFTSPPSNHTGYLPFAMTYNDSQTLLPGEAWAFVNWTGPDWLYYTAVECDTGLIVGYTCLACPTGGYCPGGGRVWPLPGYWSFDEVSPPIACGLAASCPGALTNPVVINPDGTRNTSQCAAGYTGAYCASCADAYYLDGQRCLSCGLESTQRAELSVLLLLAVALFLAVAVCVATMSPNALATAVSSVLLVQHFSLVGKLAGQEVPDSATWLTEAFSVLGMCNFDVTFIKPGCSTPQLTFLDVYYITLAVVALSCVMFTAASAVRGLLAVRSSARRHRQRTERGWGEAQGNPLEPPMLEQGVEMANCSTPKDLKESGGGGGGGGGGVVPDHSVGEPSGWWHFRARLTHSHLILGSIMYLRLTTQELQALHCTTVVQQDGGTLRVLQVDLSTVCYEGAHLRAMYLVWPLFALYCVGFPLLCCALLYTHFHAVARATVKQARLLHSSSSGGTGYATPRPLGSLPAGSRSLELEMSPWSSRRSVLPFTSAHSAQVGGGRRALVPLHQPAPGLGPTPPVEQQRTASARRRPARKLLHVPALRSPLACGRTALRVLFRCGHRYGRGGGEANAGGAAQWTASAHGHGGGGANSTYLQGHSGAVFAR